MAAVSPATSLEQAVDLVEQDVNKFHDILNGSTTTTVPVDVGVVPSVRKALTDLAAYKVPIAWAEASTATDFLQPRIFANGFYIPVSVPVVMGAAPDSGWKLFSYQADIFSTSATLTEPQLVTTTGQSIFTLVINTYNPGSGNLSIYRNGAKLPFNSYTETSTTVVTLNAFDAGVNVIGDEFEFIINERSVSTDLIAAGSVTYTPPGGAASNVEVQLSVVQTLTQTGTGTPEGVVTATKGVSFFRTDGVLTHYVKETGAGNTGWVGQGVTPHTTAALEDISDIVNTEDKVVTRLVLNTTTDKILRASGTTAGSTWVDMDGVLAHTPV